MRGLAVAIGSLAALVGCASTADYLIISVDARPAVHGARSLSVALGNAGSSRTDQLALHDQPFPVTFSISAPGRAGAIAVAIDALDDAGAIVGHGSATATLGAERADLVLDATDFVVNTDYAGDQFTSDDPEASGLQLAALPDGTWTAVFRAGCPQAGCNIFARRFDATGSPVVSAAAAGTNAFVVNTQPTSILAMPAIAATAATALAVWNAGPPSQLPSSSVACRAISTTGGLGPVEATLATETTDVVSLAALPDGLFVASWKTVVGTVDAIRMVLVAPDCAPVGAVRTVGQGALTTDFLHRGSVAASGDHMMFAWITKGDLHVRAASSAGAFTTDDLVLAPQTATEQVVHARIAAASSVDFVIAVRWAQSSASGPGRIDLLRVSAAGAPIGAPVQITDRAGSDVASSEAFGIAHRADGTVMVTWHACGALGDDSECGVFGRLLRDTGEPIGDAFVVPTTTLGDQRRPSVVALPDGFAAAWSDASHRAPDTDGQAVRARVIYPPPAP